MILAFYGSLVLVLVCLFLLVAETLMEEHGRRKVRQARRDLARRERQTAARSQAWVDDWRDAA